MRNTCLNSASRFENVDLNYNILWETYNKAASELGII